MILLKKFKKKVTNRNVVSLAMHRFNDVCCCFLSLSSQRLLILIDSDHGNLDWRDGAGNSSSSLFYICQFDEQIWLFG